MDPLCRACLERHSPMDGCQMARRKREVREREERLEREKVARWGALAGGVGVVEGGVDGVISGVGVEKHGFRPDPGVSIPLDAVLTDSAGGAVTAEIRSAVGPAVPIGNRGTGRSGDRHSPGYMRDYMARWRAKQRGRDGAA